ncbi:Flp pilus assembly protein CpaB [Virgibacillus byunsanensis]|uniref:Flp pilus assembly protein CpaB n=1 Tax=Virgibacillus byunsanensis TaxID=570945 RepID=A0ABW3LG46_9BACI
MRSRIIFLLALIMGIITTILFFNYTKQYETEEVVQQQETVQVVQTKEKIAENQVITAEVLKVVNVIKENIHPQSVSEISEVEGKISTAVMEQGEIVVAHRVKDQQDENLLLSLKIQDGYRAVSIGVNHVQSVTNMIEPEDRVDVFLTETNDDDEIISEEIFSDIRVLAVGRKMNPPQNESTYSEYSAVTLELEPNDANMLINASATGNIHFTLHPSTISSGSQD